ncbi:2513_t:CDS:2 [Entrophospora sp. SA101]|nr:2513_t:CDS:2 [Entrophospora sp. SA101]
MSENGSYKKAKPSPAQKETKRSFGYYDIGKTTRGANPSFCCAEMSLCLKTQTKNIGNLQAYMGWLCDIAKGAEESKGIKS